MTLTLHEHPFAAYCWKPLVALFERDVPFERNLVGGEADRARLGELWAMASIPVLDDDAAGLTLPESTTIVDTSIVTALRLVWFLTSPRLRCAHVCGTACSTGTS